jgi:hypothetical protein
MTIPWMFSIFVLRTEFGEYILLVLFPVVILNQSVSNTTEENLFYIKKGMQSNVLHTKIFIV